MERSKCSLSDSCTSRELCIDRLTKSAVIVRVHRTERSKRSLSDSFTLHDLSSNCSIQPFGSFVAEINLRPSCMAMCSESDAVLPISHPFAAVSSPRGARRRFRPSRRDLSKVAEFRARGASSKFLIYANRYGSRAFLPSTRSAPSGETCR